MIPVASDVRVWLAGGVTDMRCGMNSLALKVQQGLGRDPHAGDLYVFRGRSGALLKCLWHDGVGMSLYIKRLERGRFIWPAPSGGCVAISGPQFASLMPRSLEFAAAAAMPLVSLTAWELLFERFAVEADTPGVLLIIGGAGGVGSMLCQLARRLTRLTVVATASRPETADWCRRMGAHHVIDHTCPLAPQMSELACGPVTHALGRSLGVEQFLELIDLFAPFGRLGLIDAPTADLPLVRMMQKSLSLHWELMFTRSLFTTADVARQGDILADVARLTDAGQLVSPMTECLGEMSVSTLEQMHRQSEAGRVIGKLTATVGA